MIFNFQTPSSKPPLITGNNHWCRLNIKDLIVLKNQQDGHNCEIRIFVPRMHLSQLIHMLGWMVTVMMWCSNLKQVDYKVRSASFTATNNFSIQKRSLDACILPFVDLWCLKFELVWLWMLLIQIYINTSNKYKKYYYYLYDDDLLIKNIEVFKLKNNTYLSVFIDFPKSFQQ